MSAQSQKRKHKTLTIKEKIDILVRLNRNEPFSSLAREYGVGKSTIYGIKKNSANIQKFISISDCRPERQTLRKAEHPEVEEYLYRWYLQEKNRHTPISGHILATKAKFFYKQIKNKDDFVAGKKWLERFKRRYRIRLSNIKEENLSNDTNCTDKFKERLLLKVKSLDLCPSQVYNAARSGLFWRIPSLKPESVNKKSEHNDSRELVTILACSNAAGSHALKMLIVGKSNDPNAFKNINLPVHYYREKRTLIKDLFKKWFDKHFVPEVRKWLKDHNLPQKALLLLNTSDYPSAIELSTDDKSISVMFVPPNCTELIQPMDHIIKLVKQDYKKNLLLTAVSKEQPIEKTLKEFNLKDSVFVLCQSWNAIVPLTITSSWKSLWPDIVTASSDTPQLVVTLEVMKQVALKTQINIEYLEIWYSGMNEERTSNEEKINEASSSKIRNEDDDVVIPIPQIAVQDAISAFDLGLQWAEQNGASCDELLILRNLRDKALVMRFNDITKEKVGDHFNV